MDKQNKTVGVKVTAQQWALMKEATDYEGTTVATKMRELTLKWARAIKAKETT